MNSPAEERGARAGARVGALLKGKYRLERLLGVGATAAVYRAIHRNGHRVAVKLLHPELSQEPGTRSRFLREGYVANNVDHPGAVRVLDDDVAEDGSVFLVMELLEGRTLDDGAHDPLPLDEVLGLTHQLLAVLEAAHGKGIVHRDLKPENLFVTREGQLKVLDFGLARLRDESGARATHSGDVFGTPAFMPPEQALGHTDEVDARSDLWAAGATVFSLISGKLVHETGTVGELLVRTATHPARSLAEVAPDAPAPIVAVVDRALSFHKADRWPTAHAMQLALEQAALASFGRPLAPFIARPASTSRAQEPASPRHVRTLWAAALLAVLGAIGATTLILALRQPSPDAERAPSEVEAAPPEVVAPETTVDAGASLSTVSKITDAPEGDAGEVAPPVKPPVPKSRAAPSGRTKSAFDRQ